MKSDFPTPQTGQSQSAGISSKRVPGRIPESESQTFTSYIYPQGTQSHFGPADIDFLVFLFLK
jgi:hypothetical protein